MKNLENYSDFRNKVFPCLEGKDTDGKSSKVLIDFIVEGSKEKHSNHSLWLQKLISDFGVRHLRKFNE